MTQLVEQVPQILVVGDLMLDHYLWGSCERISPEAPVQVVDVNRESTVLGGAGNVISNLLALGADIAVASVLGSDASGDELVGLLKEQSVDTTSLVRCNHRKTSRKTRVVAARQQMIRVDQETRASIQDESADRLIAAVSQKLDQIDVVILSDYGKGVLTPAVTQGIIQAATAVGAKVLVDPKGTDYTKYEGAFLLTPNRKEAQEATGIELTNDDALQRAGEWLRKTCQLQYAMITLSEDGMAVFGDEMIKIPTVAREVFDVTGAGDTVIAAMAYALARKQPIHDAARFATAAAAVVVGKFGSATATHDEIADYENLLHQNRARHKLKTIPAITQIAEHYRQRGKRVVFTNGCFDILHMGHVRYLETAKGFGDVLILGLNADDSVRRLKGPERPVNPEGDRAYVLGALESVDYVVLFSDDTPYDLIKGIQPDVLVKGGDYEGKEVVGSDIAGETRLVEFVEGRSTSRIIDKMRQPSGDES